MGVTDGRMDGHYDMRIYTGTSTSVQEFELLFEKHCNLIHILPLHDHSCQQTP